MGVLLVAIIVPILCLACLTGALFLVGQHRRV
jgi:hypothetical protein